MFSKPGRHQSRSSADLTEPSVYGSAATYDSRKRYASCENILKADSSRVNHVHSKLSDCSSSHQRPSWPDLQLNKIIQAEIDKRRWEMTERIRTQYNDQPDYTVSSVEKNSGLRGFANSQDGDGSEFGLYISTRRSEESLSPPPRLYGPSSGILTQNTGMELYKGSGRYGFAPDGVMSSNFHPRHVLSPRRSSSPPLNVPPFDYNSANLTKRGSMPVLDNLNGVDEIPDFIGQKKSLPKTSSGTKYVPPPPPPPLPRKEQAEYSFHGRTEYAKNDNYIPNILQTPENNSNFHLQKGSTSGINSTSSSEFQTNSGYTTPNNNNSQIDNSLQEAAQNSSSNSHVREKLNKLFSKQFSNSLTQNKTRTDAAGADKVTSTPVPHSTVGHHSGNPSQKPVYADVEHALDSGHPHQTSTKHGTSDHTSPILSAEKGMHPFATPKTSQDSSLKGHVSKFKPLHEVALTSPTVNVYGENPGTQIAGGNSTDVNGDPEPDYAESESGISFDASSYRNKTADDDLHSFMRTKEDEKNEDGKQDEEEDPTWRPYDLFTVSERESEDDNKVFKEILKVIRGSLYFVFVAIILAGTVSSRISLFLLASDISQSKEARGRSVSLILICMCAPMAYSWLNSFMKILFGGKEWPSIKTFSMMLFFELVCTFGMCLLVFKIMPSTDFFRGITITFAMFQIPSILKVFMLDKKPRFGVKVVSKSCASVLAMLAQIGVLAYFMIMDFSVEKYSKMLTVHNSSKETKVSEMLLQDYVWELPVSLILVSLGWWENYVSSDWSLFGRVKLKFKHWRHILQETRETSNFLITPFKIALVVLMSKYLAQADFALPVWSRSTKKTEAEFHAISYSLVYIQLGSAILCTYLAGLACKLHMQKTAFAFPLILSPPVSLVLVYLQCRYEFLPVHWHTGSWYCPDIHIENLIQPIAVAGALWLSYCVVVSHIWFPRSERMAKIEKLFLTPHFTAILPDFNLTLRRRRNDKELRASRFDHFTFVGENGGDHITSEAISDYITPTIFVCATMWHETKREMTQLLKSLFRLDYGHCASKLAQDKFNIRDPDYFDIEIHIIFDDAFELDTTANRYTPNIFVRQFIDCMEDAARSVVKGFIIIPSPIKVPTPYGGRLIWTMPGQTKMVVHMKDKNKIRHRKRWSQVMYLYYLLGYRLLGFGSGSDVREEERTHSSSSNPHLRHRKKKGSHHRSRKNMPLRQLLMRVTPDEYEQIIETAESTFILTLDGDVDFKPESVKLLVDRMKKNKKVGAVCGRIHPIGSAILPLFTGPMVWYQQFEYAVGHWLQKAAEHVFGCVLCCPGCFSLFRGSAVMDDNVLKMYTTKPTEARHFIQFEQGEDRWLCTLLLQQGHRIDYSAGADALTFAPETFNEFFNQRRRWSPSTLANMMDLLASWRDTVRLNDNISRPYILYQFTLMASSILAPSTVILMITSSYHSVLGLSNWWSYVLSVIPVAIYVVVCLTQKTDTQVKVGAVLTAIYTVVMMIATVGTVISIATENFSSPNVVFLSGLGIIFVMAALLHPQEIYCLIFGAIYFLVVPSTFILLTIFYLCNLNNVSWGTREMPKKMTAEEEESVKAAEEERKKKKKSWNIFTTIGLMNIVGELREVIRNIWGLRHDLQNVQGSNNLNNQQISQNPITQKEEKPEPQPKKKQTQEVIGSEPDPSNPFWLHLEEMGSGSVERLSDPEMKFWHFLIKKYLYPLEENKEQKEKIASDLLEVRNNVVFIYIMLNFLWTVISLQLQASEDVLKDYYIIEKYEPMSLVFLSIFTVVLVVQFLGMIMHRWGTFLHLMSSTRIDWLSGAHSDEDFARFVVQEIHKHQNLEPVPDYAESEEDEDDVNLPSELGETADDNEVYSMHSSVRTSYTNQMMFPRNWNHRPSNPGHFPQYENILNHKLGQLQQQLNRVGSSHRGNANLTRQLNRKDARFFNGWGNRNANMRQKFFQQNFQFPQHPPDDRLARISIM